MNPWMLPIVAPMNEHANTTYLLSCQKFIRMNWTQQLTISTVDMVPSKKPSVRKSYFDGLQYSPRNASTSTIDAAHDDANTRSLANFRSSYFSMNLFSSWNTLSMLLHPVPKPIATNVRYRHTVANTVRPGSLHGSSSASTS